MDKTVSLANRTLADTDSATRESVRPEPARRIWAASQIFLLVYVFCAFSLAGNPELGLIEDLAGYLFFFAVIVESIRRRQIDFRIPIIFRFALGFLGWLLLILCIEGLFLDSNSALTKLDRYFDFAQVFILGLLVAIVLVKYQDIRPLEFAMYGGILYNSLLMINDVYLGGSLDRAGGGIGQPNELGIGLAIAATFSFTRIVLVSMDRQKGGNLDLVKVGALLLIQFLAAYLNFAWTGSRTGMVLGTFLLAGSVSALLYAVTLGKARMLVMVLAVVVAAPTVLQLLSDTPFLDRLANVQLFFGGKALAIQEQSLFNRSNMFQTGLDLWWEKPIFGWGFDAFRYVSGYGTYSHSNYIELLVNNGIVGLGAYLSIFLVTVLQTLTVTRTIHNKNAFRFLIFVLVAVLLASGVTSVTYYRKAHWILLGFIVALIALVPRLDPDRSAKQQAE